VFLAAILLSAAVTLVLEGRRAIVILGHPRGIRDFTVTALGDTKWTEMYAVHSLTVTRPTHGVETTTARCGADCALVFDLHARLGPKLQLEVISHRQALKDRLKAAIPVFVLVGGSVAGGLLSLRTGIVGADRIDDSYNFALIVLFVLVVFRFSRLFCSWGRTCDGVRIACSLDDADEHSGPNSYRGHRLYEMWDSRWH
jgi:hypothetical protein